MVRINILSSLYSGDQQLEKIRYFAFSYSKPQLPAAQLVHFCGKGGVRSFSAADAGGVHPAAPADSETFVQIRFAFL